MGAAQPDPSDVSGHGIKTLRSALRSRFAGDAVIDAAIDSVLSEIEHRWDCSGGMHQSEYDKLSAGLTPHLRRLLAVPLSDAKACADAFVREWLTLRGRVRWL
jgi:hypothetical protein